jgi:uncharacterized protein YjbJ (UPF0337 family)
MDDDTRMRFEGRWQEMRGRIKEPWGDLTDDDLDKTEGKWDQVVGAEAQDRGVRRRGRVALTRHDGLRTTDDPRVASRDSTGYVPGPWRVTPSTDAEWPRLGSSSRPSGSR